MSASDNLSPDQFGKAPGNELQRSAALEGNIVSSMEGPQPDREALRDPDAVRLTASDVLSSRAKVKANNDAVTSTSLGSFKPPSEAMRARAQGR
jgi:predicted xylose isomerase-like sugar epimerase